MNQQSSHPMNFQLKLNIGETEFVINDVAASHQDFFQRASFWSSLPKTGPNGETDLKLEHRITKEGYSYYSIVSEKAGQELQLGQSQKQPGVLFVKGWVSLVRGQANQVVGAAPVQGVVAPVQANVPSQQVPMPTAAPAAPVQQIPVPTQATPVTPAVAQVPGVGVTTQVPQNAQVIDQNAINNVLDKYTAGN